MLVPTCGQVAISKEAVLAKLDVYYKEKKPKIYETCKARVHKDDFLDLARRLHGVFLELYPKVGPDVDVKGSPVAWVRIRTQRSRKGEAQTEMEMLTGKDRDLQTLFDSGTGYTPALVVAILAAAGIEVNVKPRRFPSAGKGDLGPGIVIGHAPSKAAESASAPAPPPSNLVGSPQPPASAASPMTGGDGQAPTREEVSPASFQGFGGSPLTNLDPDSVLNTTEGLMAAIDEYFPDCVSASAPVAGKAPSAAEPSGQASNAESTGGAEGLQQPDENVDSFVDYEGNSFGEVDGTASAPHARDGGDVDIPQDRRVESGQARPAMADGEARAQAIFAGLDTIMYEGVAIEDLRNMRLNQGTAPQAAASGDGGTDTAEAGQTLGRRRRDEAGQPHPARQALADGAVRELGREFNNLAVAADAGDARAVERLLQQEKDPEGPGAVHLPIPRADGKPGGVVLPVDTPLNIAAKLGLVDVARALLRDGADPKGVSSSFEPPLTPLMNAVMEGHAAMIPPLIDARADVNMSIVASGDNRITLLHLACQRPLLVVAASDSFDVVSTLLRAGADPNAVDVYRRSPLADAVMVGDARLVATLVAASADVNAVIAPAEKRFKETDCVPLLYAAAVLLVSPELVQALLSAGAVRDVRGEGGRRADEQIKYEFEATDTDVHAVITDSDDEGDELSDQPPLTEEQVVIRMANAIERHSSRAECFWGHELWRHGLWEGVVSSEVLCARGADPALIDPQRRYEKLQERRQAVYQLLRGEPLIMDPDKAFSRAINDAIKAESERCMAEFEASLKRLTLGQQVRVSVWNSHNMPIPTHGIRRVCSSCLTLPELSLLLGATGERP